MKSFCIKTNNASIINYLMNSISNFPLDNVYFIDRKFKVFHNVIIHYAGNNISTFLSLLSDTLSNCVLLFYEPFIIKKILHYDYFYFDEFEQTIIENICINYLSDVTNSDLLFRKDEINLAFLNYLKNNRSLILFGFVNFRLSNYVKILNDVVTYGINKYIIEKEYSEFINLLKTYINSKVSQTDLVHLIYTNENSILLDQNRNVIPFDDNILNSKYVSDISFSSNDYALNTLISLLPKRILVHSNNINNEFINTLKLVFESRISICSNCNICRTYRVLSNSIKEK